MLEWSGGYELHSISMLEPQLPSLTLIRPRSHLLSLSLTLALLFPPSIRSRSRSLSPSSSLPCPSSPPSLGPCIHVSVMRWFVRGCACSCNETLLRLVLLHMLAALLMRKTPLSLVCGVAYCFLIATWWWCCSHM